MKQIKLTVPNNWNDITVKQYQELIKILDSKKKEKQKIMDMVSLFCGVSKKDLKNFAYGDVEKIGNILKKMTGEDPSEIEMTKHVNFKGHNYSVIPNMSEMKTGEFVDLESYCEDVTANLHKITGVLYRKQTEKVNRWGRYKVEDYDPNPEKQELMLEFPMGYVLGVLNFFFHLGEKLLIDSANYLEKQK
jgi:Ni,Fe-hydrogenase I large subunit